MYEHVSVVGERGQITIPKAIREKEGLKKNDRVIFKSEGGKLVVEKAQVKKRSKKELEKLYKEYYAKYGDLERQTAEEWKYASVEADRMLDDY